MITRIDNLLGPASAPYILSRLADSAVPWYYLPVTASPDDLRIPQYRGSFSHTTFNHEQGACSPLWDLCLQILLAALDQQGQQLSAVYRARLGLNTRTPQSITHSPHIDQGHEHRVGLFYVNDSSGPTRVYRELCEYGVPDQPKQFTELARITPCANTWVDFSGQHWHSSSTPDQHETRVVLTINYSIV